jgi:YbgC/YbaW family acyl-CoA thioester hydrolase
MNESDLANDVGAEGTQVPRLITSVDVMFFDTDCAAVVHNLAYLRFIETNRTLLAGQLGMGLADMASTGVYPVVVRSEVDYRKPAALGDALEVDGWLESFDRTCFWCGFEVKRKRDGALMVTARQMLAVVRMPAAKPMRLPEEWAHRWPTLSKTRVR